MKENYNENIKGLPYSRKMITDNFNANNGTNYSYDSIRYVGHFFYNSLAIGVIGFASNQFGIINYTLHDVSSQVKITWGGSTIILDQATIKDKLENVLFQQYTQQIGHSQLYVYVFEFV